MRPIKFRGRAINGEFVYGLLTKKKIRANGSVVFAIATGDCLARETIPVNENSIRQFVGTTDDGREVYEGDILTDSSGGEWNACLRSIELRGLKLKEAQP